MIFRFENCLIDTGTYEVRRNGDAVPVEPQVFDLLILLIENRDRLVTKDEIVDRIWRGRVVSEAALNSRIKSARQAIGDSGAAQRLIRTIRGRGFRFIGQASQGNGAVPCAPAKPVSDRPAVAAGVAEADRGCRSSVTATHAPLAGFPSGEATVAVFPFLATKADPLRVDLALSVFETLNAKLMAWRWFKVISSELWLAHAGGADPIRASRALDVRYIVTGSVRARQNSVRLAVQLVDGLSGYQLWAAVYDQPIHKLPVVEDRVASRIVAAIELELQKAERTRAIKKNADQLDIYELTQRAYWHYAKRTKEHNDRALQLFGAAMDRDPLYVPALTGQAACHFWAGQRIWAEDAGASLRQGLRKAQEAVALDDRYPTAQLFLAQSLLFLGRHEAAVSTVRRALRLNPSYAGAWAFLGHALTASGRFEAAVRAMQQAFELTSHDTRRFFWLSNLALARFHLGDHESAAREAREAVALQPDHWLANQVLMMALAETGRAGETEPLFRAVRTAEPNVTLHDFANRMPYQNPSDLSTVVNALRRSCWTG